MPHSQKPLLTHPPTTHAHSAACAARAIRSIPSPLPLYSPFSRRHYPVHTPTAKSQSYPPRPDPSPDFALSDLKDQFYFRFPYALHSTDDTVQSIPQQPRATLSSRPPPAPATAFALSDLKDQFHLCYPCGLHSPDYTVQSIPHS